MLVVPRGGAPGQERTQRRSVGTLSCDRRKTGGLCAAHQIDKRASVSLYFLRIAFSRLSRSISFMNSSVACVISTHHCVVVFASKSCWNCWPIEGLPDLLRPLLGLPPASRLRADLPGGAVRVDVEILSATAFSPVGISLVGTLRLVARVDRHGTAVAVWRLSRANLFQFSFSFLSPDWKLLKGNNLELVAGGGFEPPTFGL
jgi:hypothetical protein